jgi:hypothetical protein
VAAYGLQQYQPLVAAMRTGNVKLLEDALAHQQHQFIQEVCGIWALEYVLMCQEINCAT